MDSSSLLNALSDKLQTANKTVVLQKKRQRQQIEQRLQNIQIIFTAKKKFENDTLEKSKFSVDKITGLTNETIKNMNLKNRKEEQLVRNLKQQTQNDLNNCERDHQQKTQEIVEKQTQKIAQIIQQLTKKSKIITDANDQTIFQLKKALHNLQKDFHQQIDQRKNNCKQIQEDISNQVTKFNMMIEKQRQRRVLSEQKIQNMIQQIKNKVNTQTQNVSTRRKKNNASLLKLIEGACQRLEEKINMA